jgi:hypothetical protein
MLVVVAEDSFKKIKKGAKETGQGLEDTSEGAMDTAEGVMGGIKETAEGVMGGIKETADVFDDATKQATHADTYESTRKGKSTRKGTKKS